MLKKKVEKILKNLEKSWKILKNLEKNMLKCHKILCQLHIKAIRMQHCRIKATDGVEF